MDTMDTVESGHPARTGRQALGAAAFSAIGLMVWCELHFAAGGAEYSAPLWLGASAAWVGVGALLTRLAGPTLHRQLGIPAVAAMPLLAVGELWAARTVPAWCFGLSGGTGVPWTVALAALLLGGPLGLVCGAVLAPAGQTGAERAAFWRRVAIGLTAGSGLFTLGSLLLWHQARIAAVLAVVLACLASVAGGAGLFGRGRLVLGAWALAIAIAAAALEALSGGRSWLLATGGRGGLLGAGRCAAESATPDGPMVTMLRADGTATVYLAGAPSAATPDPAAREDAVFACAQAPALGTVLLVGAGRPELVRELLSRGAGQLHLDETFHGTAQALAPHLASREADALGADGVQQAPGGDGVRRYDLVIAALPEPLSAAAAARASTTGLKRLCGLLAPNGTLVLLPSAGTARSTALTTRLWANCRELVESRTVRQCRMHPGPRLRVAASRSGDLPGDAAAAARLYRGRLGPAGQRPAPVSFEELSRLIDVPAAENFSRGLEQRGGSAGLIGEGAASRRLLLAATAERLAVPAPSSAAALAFLMKLPLAAPFVVLWLLLAPVWLAGRRTGAAGPGRGTLLIAAALTGFVGVGALGTWCSTLGALRTSLAAALPLIATAAALGLWCGGRFAGRFPGAIERSPRLGLAAAEFCFLPILLLAPLLVDAGAGSRWADLAHGAGALLLGTACGLHLEATRAMREPNEQAGWSCAVLAAACAGALAAGLLAATLLPEVLEPAGMFLFLLAAKVASVGLLAAGAGRRAVPVPAGDAPNAPDGSNGSAGGAATPAPAP
jgi:hypothetical protein